MVVLTVLLPTLKVVLLPYNPIEVAFIVPTLRTPVLVVAKAVEFMILLTVALPMLSCVTLRFTLAPILCAVAVLIVAGNLAVRTVPEVKLSALAAIAMALV